MADSAPFMAAASAAPSPASLDVLGKLKSALGYGYCGHHAVERVVDEAISLQSIRQPSFAPIIHGSTTKSVPYYLVKWKNLSSIHNCWVAQDVLLGLKGAAARGVHAGVLAQTKSTSATAALTTSSPAQFELPPATMLLHVNAALTALKCHPCGAGGVAVSAGGPVVVEVAQAATAAASRTVGASKPKLKQQARRSRAGSDDDEEGGMRRSRSTGAKAKRGSADADVAAARARPSRRAATASAASTSGGASGERSDKVAGSGSSRSSFAATPSIGTGMVGAWSTLEAGHDRVYGWEITQHIEDGGDGGEGDDAVDGAVVQRAVGSVLACCPVPPATATSAILSGAASGATAATAAGQPPSATTVPPAASSSYSSTEAILRLIESAAGMFARSHFRIHTDAAGDDDDDGGGSIADADEDEGTAGENSDAQCRDRFYKALKRKIVQVQQGCAAKIAEFKDASAGDDTGSNSDSDYEPEASSGADDDGDASSDSDLLASDPSQQAFRHTTVDRVIAHRTLTLPFTRVVGVLKGWGMTADSLLCQTEASNGAATPGAALPDSTSAMEPMPAGSGSAKRKRGVRPEAPASSSSSVAQLSPELLRWAHLLTSPSLPGLRIGPIDMSDQHNDSSGGGASVPAAPSSIPSGDAASEALRNGRLDLSTLADPTGSDLFIHIPEVLVAWRGGGGGGSAASANNGGQGGRSGGKRSGAASNSGSSGSAAKAASDSCTTFSWEWAADPHLALYQQHALQIAITVADAQGTPVNGTAAAGGGGGCASSVNGVSTLHRLLQQYFASINFRPTVTEVTNARQYHNAAFAALKVRHESVLHLPLRVGQAQAVSTSAAGAAAPSSTPTAASSFPPLLPASIAGQGLHLNASPTFCNGRRLFPYQLNGVSWMLNRRGSHINCVLGDAMGLGKTAQTIAYIAMLMAGNVGVPRDLREAGSLFRSGSNSNNSSSVTSSSGSSGSSGSIGSADRIVGWTGPPCTGPILIVAPLSTVSHWHDEITAMLGAHVKVVKYHGSRQDRDVLRQYEFGWCDGSRAVADGEGAADGGSTPKPYASAASGSASSSSSSSSATTNRKEDAAGGPFYRFNIVIVAKDRLTDRDTTDHSLLCSIGWQLVVCDEAHEYKNPSSARREALAQVPAASKLFLTGTLIQNGVADLWSLLDLLHPGRYGGYDEWKARFEGVDDGGDVNGGARSGAGAGGITSLPGSRAAQPRVSPIAHLSDILTSHALIRSRELVKLDVPDCEQIVQLLPMTPVQSMLYIKACAERPHELGRPPGGAGSGDGDDDNDVDMRVFDAATTSNGRSKELRDLMMTTGGSGAAAGRAGNSGSGRGTNDTNLYSQLRKISNQPCTEPKFVPFVYEAFSRQKEEEEAAKRRMRRQVQAAGDDGDGAGAAMLIDGGNDDAVDDDAEEVDADDDADEGDNDDSASSIRLSPADRIRAMLQASAKTMWLDQHLPTMKRNGNRVLIFSQYVIVLKLLRQYLDHKRYQYEYIDGSTHSSERVAAMARFNGRSSIAGAASGGGGSGGSSAASAAAGTSGAPGALDDDNDAAGLQKADAADDEDPRPFIFLLSTRAGGLGINLQTADTVIIYDSDWNPMNDQQAIGRAHRLGQTRKVTVHRLVTKDTYEHNCMRRVAEKKELQANITKKLQEEAQQRANALGSSGGGGGDGDASVVSLFQRKLDRSIGDGALSADERAELASASLLQLLEECQRGNGAASFDTFPPELLQKLGITTATVKHNADASCNSSSGSSGGAGRGAAGFRSPLEVLRLLQQQKDREEQVQRLKDFCEGMKIKDVDRYIADGWVMIESRNAGNGGANNNNGGDVALYNFNTKATMDVTTFLVQAGSSAAGGGFRLTRSGGGGSGAGAGAINYNENADWRRIIAEARAAQQLEQRAKQERDRQKRLLLEQDEFQLDEDEGVDDDGDRGDGGDADDDVSIAGDAAAAAGSPPPSSSKRPRVSPSPSASKHQRQPSQLLPKQLYPSHMLISVPSAPSASAAASGAANISSATGDAATSPVSASSNTSVYVRVRLTAAEVKRLLEGMLTFGCGPSTQRWDTLRRFVMSGPSAAATQTVSASHSADADSAPVGAQTPGAAPIQAAPSPTSYTALQRQIPLAVIQTYCVRIIALAVQAAECDVGRRHMLAQRLASHGLPVVGHATAAGSGGLSSAGLGTCNSVATGGAGDTELGAGAQPSAEVCHDDLTLLITGSGTGDDATATSPASTSSQCIQPQTDPSQLSSTFLLQCDRLLPSTSAIASSSTMVISTPVASSPSASSSIPHAASGAGETSVADEALFGRRGFAWILRKLGIGVSFGDAAAPPAVTAQQHDVVPDTLTTAASASAAPRPSPSPAPVPISPLMPSSPSSLAFNVLHRLMHLADLHHLMCDAAREASAAALQLCSHVSPPLLEEASGDALNGTATPIDIQGDASGTAARAGLPAARVLTVPASSLVAVLTGAVTHQLLRAHPSHDGDVADGSQVPGASAAVAASLSLPMVPLLRPPKRGKKVMPAADLMQSKRGGDGLADADADDDTELRPEPGVADNDADAAGDGDGMQIDDETGDSSAGVSRQDTYDQQQLQRQRHWQALLAERGVQAIVAWGSGSDRYRLHRDANLLVGVWMHGWQAKAAQTQTMPTVSAVDADAPTAMAPPATAPSASAAQPTGLESTLIAATSAYVVSPSHLPPWERIRTDTTLLPAFAEYVPCDTDAITDALEGRRSRGADAGADAGSDDGDGSDDDDAPGASPRLSVSPTALLLWPTHRDLSQRVKSLLGAVRKQLSLRRQAIKKVMLTVERLAQVTVTRALKAAVDEKRRQEKVKARELAQQQAEADKLRKAAEKLKQAEAASKLWSPRELHAFLSLLGTCGECLRVVPIRNHAEAASSSSAAVPVASPSSSVSVSSSASTAASVPSSSTAAAPAGTTVEQKRWAALALEVKCHYGIALPPGHVLAYDWSYLLPPAAPVRSPSPSGSSSSSSSSVVAFSASDWPGTAIHDSIRRDVDYQRQHWAALCTPPYQKRGIIDQQEVLSSKSRQRLHLMYKSILQAAVMLSTSTNGVPGKLLPEPAIDALLLPDAQPPPITTHAQLSALWTLQCELSSQALNWFVGEDGAAVDIRAPGAPSSSPSNAPAAASPAGTSSTGTIGASAGIAQSMMAQLPTAAMISPQELNLFKAQMVRLLSGAIQPASAPVAVMAQLVRADNGALFSDLLPTIASKQLVTATSGATVSVSVPPQQPVNAVALTATLKDTVTAFKLPSTVVSTLQQTIETRRMLRHLLLADEEAVRAAVYRANSDHQQGDSGPFAAAAAAVTPKGNAAAATTPSSTAKEGGRGSSSKARGVPASPLATPPAVTSTKGTARAISIGIDISYPFALPPMGMYPRYLTPGRDWAVLQHLRSVGTTASNGLLMGTPTARNGPPSSSAADSPSHFKSCYGTECLPDDKGPHPMWASPAFHVASQGSDAPSSSAPAASSSSLGGRGVASGSASSSSLVATTVSHVPWNVLQRRFTCAAHALVQSMHAGGHGSYEA